MRVLVTGGAGFIGSNIVAHLVQQGYDVTVLDDLSSGQLCNIYEYIDKKTVKFINADIKDKDTVAHACENKDIVFHLAASVGRQRSLDNTALDSSTNLIGTVNVLEGMRTNNIDRIIYSSSAAIFGELITSTISEDHPQNADSPYGVSKLAAEKMILCYNHLYDFKGVCLRYFNIYGINQRYDLYGNVIPIFAKNIYSNIPITIYGDGSQTRDFAYVSDIADVNLLAAEYEKGDVFNIGSGSSITINKLARLMQEIAGINVDVKYAPERPADVKHCKADISKVENYLRFKPKVSIEDGLEKYLKWYRDNCI